MPDVRVVLSGGNKISFVEEGITDLVAYFTGAFGDTVESVEVLQNSEARLLASAKETKIEQLRNTCEAATIQAVATVPWLCFLGACHGQ